MSLEPRAKLNQDTSLAFYKIALIDISTSYLNYQITDIGKTIGYLSKFA